MYFIFMNTVIINVNRENYFAFHKQFTRLMIAKRKNNN